MVPLALGDPWTDYECELALSESLLQALPGAPVLTVQSAATLIGRTYPAANNAVAQHVDAGVLKQITIGRRNRAYEAPEIITAFTALERQLASPRLGLAMSVILSQDDRRPGAAAAAERADHAGSMPTTPGSADPRRAMEASCACSLSGVSVASRISTVAHTNAHVWATNAHRRSSSPS